MAKDANSHDDQSGGGQVSRVTRQQAQQNGGAHSGSSESQGGSEEIENSGALALGSDANPSSKNAEDDFPANPDSESSSGEVSPSIREETNGENTENEPPAKRAKTDRRSRDPEKADFDIFQALLGAIQNLNSSLNRNTSGIRSEFKGLASSMTDNFKKLSQRMMANDPDESDRENSDKDSSWEEEGGVIHSKVVHPISEEEDEGSKETQKSPTTPTKQESRQENAEIQTEVKKSIFAKKRAQIVKVRQTGDSIDEDLAVILSDKFWGENVMKRESFVEKVQKSL